MRRGKALQGYGLQLREKQKVKRIYFVLEGQFRNYFERAARMKGITGENLLSLLERRLDNAVYRAGFATSRRQARQLVNHGHVEVNGRKVDIPSFQVKAGDTVSIKEASRGNAHVEGAWQTAGGRGRPNWIARSTSSSSSSFTASNSAASRRRAPGGFSEKPRARVAYALVALFHTKVYDYGNGSTQPLDGFSDASPPRRRGRDFDRALRPLLRAAVRARLRHDHRQLPAPRAALFDRGRGHHRR